MVRAEDFIPLLYFDWAAEEEYGNCSKHIHTFQKCDYLVCF